MSNKLMIIGKGKKHLNSVVLRKKIGYEIWKSGRIRGYNTGEEGGGSRHLFAR